MPKGEATKGKGPGVLWIKMHVSYQGDDCLIWPHTRLVDGYGVCSYNGKRVRAHVMMCELYNGPSPGPGYEASHNCRQGHTGCCNPRHLEWKTRADNQNDRYRYGQRISKRSKPRVKLTLEQVEEIRRLKGAITQQAIADRFGVSRTNIIMIHKGETWSGKKRLPKVLTPEQVSRIRTSDLSLDELAREFDRSPATICKIKNRDSYKYLP